MITLSIPCGKSTHTCFWTTGTYCSHIERSNFLIELPQPSSADRKVAKPDSCVVYAHADGWFYDRNAEGRPRIMCRRNGDELRSDHIFWKVWHLWTCDQSRTQCDETDTAVYLLSFRSSVSIMLGFLRRKSTTRQQRQDQNLASVGIEDLLLRQCSLLLLVSGKRERFTSD